MQVAPNGWSIQVVGSWNLAIFAIDWLGQHIFETQQLAVEISTSPGLPTRYIGNGVVLVPTPDRIIVFPRSMTEEGLAAAETVASRIVERLPHTPMGGVGVNFQFIEEAPGADLLAMLDQPEAAGFADAGFEVLQRAVTSQLRSSDAQIVNLTRTLLASGALVFDFNFHSDARRAEQALAALNHRAVGHRNTALAILDSVYSLELS